MDFILKTAKRKLPLHENSFVKATAPIVSINVLLNSRFHYEISVFIHSIKFLISLTTLPLIILDNATNKDRIVTIIMIHCSFMFDSLLLYSAASFSNFSILSICVFVSRILLDIPSRLLDDTEPFL